MHFDGNNITLSPKSDRNYVQINYEDYYLSYLGSKIDGNKGASSNLFRLIDPYGETEERVIKICKTPLENRNGRRRISRFKREISAFKRAQKRSLQGIVQYYHDGTLEIGDQRFLYFIMEKADEDLSSFLESNKFDFTINQKLSFCYSILNGIRQLHDIGIYHRDIKHDNILRVGKEFKIGDLGLVEFQDRDFDFDYEDEKIGPYGWLCPEATNKMLTGGKRLKYTYCKYPLFNTGLS